MDKSLSIALAQLNLLVGDIENNAKKILTVIDEHKKVGTDIVIFSELTLTGYPPEDLIYRKDFALRCEKQLARIAQAADDIAVIVGHPHYEEGKCYNALSFFWQKKLHHRYFKQRLPNYGVFDEERYFTAGDQVGIVEFKQHRLGLLICEDIWFNEPVDDLKQHGMDILLSINASPYYHGKPDIREQLLVNHCQRTGCPLVYVNQVGGQDEVIFDGDSKVLNSEGLVIQQLASFEEGVATVSFSQQGVIPVTLPVSKEKNQLAEIYQALVLGLRDYVHKNRFKGVTLGLSGGIDSALTLAIAVDALGKENVQAVMMPFRYTSQMSVEDAKQQAETLGITFNIISIEPIYDAFMAQLQGVFEGTTVDTTEENLQARCRGIILMAISNKRGLLVLSTGNKSETAVGYSTLYGDMVGGFAVLKDVYKTLVYQLAHYRNSLAQVIPERVIERQPSAELAPNQRDQDSLPPYEVLDAILTRYVEEDASVSELVSDGFDDEIVRKIIKLVDINEYKRRQGAIGPKITAKSFGRERRYPITSGFGRHNW